MAWIFFCIMAVVMAHMCISVFGRTFSPQNAPNNKNNSNSNNKNNTNSNNKNNSNSNNV